MRFVPASWRRFDPGVQRWSRRTSAPKKRPPNRTNSRFDGVTAAGGVAGAPRMILRRGRCGGLVCLAMSASRKGRTFISDRMEATRLSAHRLNPCEPFQIPRV